jgi:hypothetical protein
LRDDEYSEIREIHDIRLVQNVLSQVDKMKSCS